MNAGALIDPAIPVVRIVGIAAFLAVVWLSVFRPSVRTGPTVPPRGGAGVVDLRGRGARRPVRRRPR